MTSNSAPRWFQSHPNNYEWTLQNLWFLWCESHIRLLGRVREFIFLFACFTGAYFSRFLVTFVDFGIKMLPKMEHCYLPKCVQVAPFLDQVPTSGHSWVIERIGIRIWTQMLPQGAKMRVKNTGKRLQSSLCGSTRNALPPVALAMFVSFWEHDFPLRFQHVFDQVCNVWSVFDNFIFFVIFRSTLWTNNIYTQKGRFLLQVGWFRTWPGDYILHVV